MVLVAHINARRASRLEKYPLRHNHEAATTLPRDRPIIGTGTKSANPVKLDRPNVRYKYSFESDHTRLGIGGCTMSRVNLHFSQFNALSNGASDQRYGLNKYAHPQ